jgi:DnaJ-class molecular chaperone
VVGHYQHRKTARDTEGEIEKLPNQGRDFCPECAGSGLVSGDICRVCDGAKTLTYAKAQAVRVAFGKRRLFA